MSRKVRRVPVSLDSRDVEDLSEDEIRIILRGADDIIGSGGRGLLAKILKGSRQKTVLEHELDRSPVYGALSELSLEQITARIDWLIIEGYLRIEYDYRLPLLVYTKRGWEIERETYADELLKGIDRLLAEGDALQDLRWLTERNPEVLQLVLEKIADTGDPRYLPVLKPWQNKATRRISDYIRETRRALNPNAG
jgi:superfamily II DNA helicase RecQ